MSIIPKKVDITIGLISIALLSGCSTNKPVDTTSTEIIVQKSEDEKAAEKAEEYRKQFEKLHIDTKETVSNPNVEQYKKDYWLLVADFMAGGFSTQQNLDYHNEEYPREYYQYCIKDINADGIPEFLLGYGYNGNDPTEWEIYKTGNSYKECYVGTTMYYDPEDNIVFSGYGSDINAYSFDGNKLRKEFSYYMDGEVHYDEDSESEENYIEQYYYEDSNSNKKELTENTYKKQLNKYYDKDNIKIEGKRLTSENVADDLGIDKNSFELERAYRSYLGLLHYFVKNKEYDYIKDYRFTLAYIDNDDIPEMVAAGYGNMEMFYYKNGGWLKGEWSMPDDSSNKGVDTEHYYSYYPHKNIYKLYGSDWGNSWEEYYTIRGERNDCLIKINKQIQEELFNNTFIKDKNGEFLYNYCVNGEVVTEKETEAIKDTLFDVYDLGEEVRFEDTESFFFQDIMTFLEKETGYYK